MSGRDARSPARRIVPIVTLLLTLKADRGTIASTSPGSRVVYVCSPQFAEKQHREPGLTAALVIHEELHSLGLSENPPSSQAITAQVISRCGR